MTAARRASKPEISLTAQAELAQFELYLRQQQDLSFATWRNYLSDLGQFCAWYEQANPGQPFRAAAITTPSLVSYRSYLQTILKPASVNRSLITLKRYF